ncbi:LIM domain-containing protein A-like [Anopheles moucheti]|uniref:LIM domain-containing protein A-like n=1 Tax=Anopheles moucheti TaxID=186751 RepID=UPI0022EFF311|nr:LIM domain-containing protein A-like [Anopheles moucheti]
MKHFLVLSALVLALASARPEGYSYYTPHVSSSGHSATSSASLQFTSGAGASGTSAVDDCEEPAHEQLTPFQHSQVHFFAPQASAHSESSSYLSASSGHHEHQSSLPESSSYLSASSGHHEHQSSLPVLSHASVSGGASDSSHYHYQHQEQQQQHHQTVQHQVHHHVEPQIEYFTNVHNHQNQHSHQQQHHTHHEASVHYVQQPVVKEEVHKHVYVHVAPEEKEEIHQKVILPTYTKQKHYKIIFIKAPPPPTTSKVVLPQQPVNEEKTLVYVLHKKPELEQEIVVPAPATSKPSKPEVYFIKYKTKKQEHQHSYHHEEQHSSSSLGGSSTSGTSGGYEVADLSGFGGSFGNSFAPIVVTEGSYHSTTPAPVKVTTVHSVSSSSSVAPSSSYVSSTASSHHGHKGQSIKVTNIGLSGYSTGGSGSVVSSSSSGSNTSSRQRGSKKSCGKCTKTNSAPVSVGGTLDAFVSNVF